MPTIVILALILDYSVWVVVRGVRRRRAGQGGCCGSCRCIANDQYRTKPPSSSSLVSPRLKALARSAA